ncbi:multicomponent Na+:H+ antiporter subunit G [Devosia enhydra]|uniref:Multicomponent Na+:H+ antiporter subunit G n=1 Tax=Devosia enhydra TaxID=665118 RepID=A0A1K2I0K3_9HYPH|nr:monovalent cation/H(+) antiporter subunit G [Devosia enhydra]SFZ85902.1 multicomponent Na+:H+ antiporter subunit G [Devosia enhydra]
MSIAELFALIAALFVVIGSVFVLLATIGLLRLPDLYTRMHAASKAGAIGSGLLLIAIALVAQDGAVTIRALFGLVFIVLTTPVSAHLLARAAYRVGLRPHSTTRLDELADYTPPRS